MSALDLRGKNAVVTGAASGIGQALAIALAQRGADVALLDIEDDRLGETIAAVEQAGARVLPLALDVSDRAAVAAAATRVGAELGPVHVLCSNAGVGLRSPILEMPDENFDWLFAVNVTGSFNVVKAFVPAMCDRPEGAHLLLTLSTSAIFESPLHGNTVYGATKMAMLGIARGLREELGPRRVGVTALCPGMVATNSRRSGRQRPARFGGPFDRPDTNRVQAEMMAPDEVARIALRALEDDVFLAITHPVSSRERYLERHALIVDAFDYGEQVIPELGISTTLPALPNRR
jgi:NAD(P)-dependent dehydrogenase (short-subunit alcohol dehydrogenase family)